MNWKISLCFIVCGLAALSPAPIKDPEGAKHVLPYQSPSQVKAEQKYNGAIGVVGTESIQKKYEPSGEIQNDPGASAIVAGAHVPAATASENINIGSKRLKLEESGGLSPLWIATIVILIVGVVLFGLKTFLEKVGPAPRDFNPAEKLGKTFEPPAKGRGLNLR